MLKFAFTMPLFVSLAAVAGPNEAIITVQTPDGIRTVSVTKSGANPTASKQIEDMRKSYQDLMGRVKVEKVAQLKSQGELEKIYAFRAQELVVKFIRLGANLLDSNGIHLLAGKNPPVSYKVEKFNSFGWTTDGFITDCWACGLGDDREQVAALLGISTGNLYEKVSANPRYTAAKLVRSSANLIRISYSTVEMGVVELPIVFQLEDNYLPFIADMSSVADEANFGKQTIGVEQYVRIEASTELAPKDHTKMTAAFGGDSLYIAGSAFKSLETMQASTELSPIFQEVAIQPVQKRASEQSVSQIIHDISPFVKVTNKVIELPGTSSGFWSFL